jgi:two-component system, LytTR family, response regulator LytT
MKTNLLNTLNVQEVGKHLFYWMSFVLFFTVVWGTYDMDFHRNFLIQIFGLPARILLVYLCLFYIFPVFLLKKKYLQFFCSYLGLLLLTGILIQRPLMIYYVQPVFWPEWDSKEFFAVTEMVNTILDVNLALILPGGYFLYKEWQSSQQKAQSLEKQQKETATGQNFIYLKVEKSVQKIFLDDIIMIESLRNYVRVETLQKQVIAYGSISSMEDILPKNEFLRVHRSFIVSLKQVRSFSPSKLTLDKKEIPVGRTYKEKVKERLGYF